MLVVFATNVGDEGGEKTQPTGTTLEDVVELVEEVSLLVLEETVLEDVVELEVVTIIEEVEELEVVEVPFVVRTTPTPAAITTTTTTATATTILPIPLREVLAIIGENKIGSIFKTSQGGSTTRAALKYGFLRSMGRPAGETSPT